MARTRRGRQARQRGRGRGGGGRDQPGPGQDQPTAQPPPRVDSGSSDGHEEDHDDNDDELREALQQSLAMAGIDTDLRRREEEDLQRAIRESMVTSARAAAAAGNWLAAAANRLEDVAASSSTSGGSVQEAAAEVTSAAANASSAAEAAARLSLEAARPLLGRRGARARRGGRRGRRGKRRGGHAAPSPAAGANVSPDVVDLSDSFVGDGGDQSVSVIPDDEDDSAPSAAGGDDDDSSGDEYRPPDSPTLDDGVLGTSMQQQQQQQQQQYQDGRLNNDEVTRRMRRMFENSLLLHADGQHMQACKAICTRLYPHQMYALAWMAKRENTKNIGVNGGVLADDMGLGKTLSILALILTNFHDGRPLARPQINFQRRLDKAVLRFLPQQLRGAQERPWQREGDDGSERQEAGSTLSRSKIASSLSLSDLLGNRRESGRRKDTRGKVKSSKPKVSAIAVLAGDGMNGGGGGTSKADIARDLEQIDESLLSEDDSPDEFDSMLEGTKAASLSERLGIDERKTSELLNSGSSSQDSSLHHNDGLSDDEEYLGMTEAERDRKFRPKLNVDGAGDDGSEEDENEKERGGVGKRRRPDNGETSQDSKFPRLADPEGEEEDEEEEEEKDEVEEDEEELPDLDAVPSTSQTNRTPPKASEQLSKELVGAPELTPEQKCKLVVVPGKPALKGRRPGATLIVTPASLISHWIEQVDIHVDRRVDLKLFVHYGQSKASLSTTLSDQDVVLTTYGTLSAEFGSRSHSPLLATRWLRVCLDEGHGIKNHRTKTAKAAAMLKADRKWIISGTPIQNNLGELWSLLFWLKFEPYASHRPHFKRDIENRVRHGDPRGLQRLQTVIEAICLRRTKEDEVNGQPLVKLPKKDIRVRRLEFTQEERAIYKAYETKGRDMILRFLRRGTLLRNYAHVFAIMMRLRQLCCHEELLPIKWKDMKEGGALDDIMEMVRQQEEAEAAAAASKAETSERGREMAERLRQMIRDGITDDCSVCLSDINMPVITVCQHVYCRPCITQVIETACPPPARCPLCRTDIGKHDLLEAAKDEEEDEDDDFERDPFEDIAVEVSSTKVNAALRELEGTRRDFPGQKTIVVSQFTSYLSILQPLLTDSKFRYTRLDGTMSSRQRSEVIADFQDQSSGSPEVLLLSLKAGGVGLNLTAANRMILLDPAWNPATEDQCFDRIHRLGQVQDVTVTKFVMQDSIEERMLALQEKKKQLISGAFRQTEVQRREQRIQDIRQIFGL